MRYLLLSDVHSNLEALYTCLELAAGKYDTAVCLGDLVGYGPNPNEVIDKVQNLCQPVIRGNHDKACCGIDDAKEFNPYARMATLWTQEKLTPKTSRVPARPSHGSGRYGRIHDSCTGRRTMRTSTFWARHKRSLCCAARKLNSCASAIRTFKAGS